LTNIRDNRKANRYESFPIGATQHTRAHIQLFLSSPIPDTP